MKVSRNSPEISPGRAPLHVTLPALYYSSGTFQTVICMFKCFTEFSAPPLSIHSEFILSVESNQNGSRNGKMWRSEKNVESKILQSRAVSMIIDGYTYMH